MGMFQPAISVYQPEANPIARLQICPLYIFGNNPPQMVFLAGSKYWKVSRLWRLGFFGPNLQPWIGISHSFLARWWFQIFLIFTPIWGRFPFWLIFFRWVETTNQLGFFFATPLRKRLETPRKTLRFTRYKHCSSLWKADSVFIAVAAGFVLVVLGGGKLVLKFFV